MTKNRWLRNFPRSIQVNNQRHRRWIAKPSSKPRDIDHRIFRCNRWTTTASRRRRREAASWGACNSMTRWNWIKRSSQKGWRKGDEVLSYQIESGFRGKLKVLGQARPTRLPTSKDSDGYCLQLRSEIILPTTLRVSTTYDFSSIFL